MEADTLVVLMALNAKNGFQQIVLLLIQSRTGSPQAVLDVAVIHLDVGDILHQYLSQCSITEDLKPLVINRKINWHCRCSATEIALHFWVVAVASHEQCTVVNGMETSVKKCLQAQVLESMDMSRFSKRDFLFCFVKGQLQAELIAELILCEDQMMERE